MWPWPEVCGTLAPFWGQVKSVLRLRRLVVGKSDPQNQKERPMTLSRLGVLVIALKRRGVWFKAFVIFVVLAAPQANAQERGPRQFPRVELFVGYSYANVNLGSQSSLFAPAGRSYNGGQIDAKFNLRKHIALLFDFAEESGRSKNPDFFGYETHMQLDTTQFLVGPEFTLRKRNFNTFAHTLFGLTRTSLSAFDGYTYGYGGSTADYISLIHRYNLAFGAGGGIERNWKKHFAFRLFQADYIPTRLDGKWESHFRVDTGVIVKF